jgi:prolyl-tRNA editing enzyme YbaK/EbsC (Cys-tRNA(Pro) deacylase)
MVELAEANKRFLEDAQTSGLAVEIAEMLESTRTAACRCDVAQIVKSLVFREKASGKPYLLMVAGKNRVNERGAAELIGEELSRPDAQYIRDVNGYTIGGIPPLAHKEAWETFIDTGLFDYDVILAAAGTSRSVFATTASAPSAVAAAKKFDLT